jgi:hypothetical protein
MYAVLLAGFRVSKKNQPRAKEKPPSSQFGGFIFKIKTVNKLKQKP